MSDYPTESQRRSWNNDGMDPDWKPDINNYNYNYNYKSEPLEKLKKLINLCGELSSAFSSRENEINLNNDSSATRVTKSNIFWREFLKAYDEVKFK